MNMHVEKKNLDGSEVLAVDIKGTVGEFSQSMKSSYIDLQTTWFAP